MLTSYQALRSRISRFVNERDWGKFHQPKNLVLALAGECGELCEIFQWKGYLENLTNFSPDEVVHVGEEIADVLIYSIRIADVCGVNLPCAITDLLSRKATLSAIEISAEFQNVNDQEWGNLLFNDVDKVVAHHSFALTKSSSPRDITLDIQSEIGKTCFLFSGKTENYCSGMQSWTSEEYSELATSIATICVLLTYICRISNLKLSSCVTDKINKNERKYPVHLAKGSSAKYTAYEHKKDLFSLVISSGTQLATIIITGVICFWLGFSVADKNFFL